LHKGLYLIHFHTTESSHDIKARIVREKDVERIWVPVHAEIEEQSLIPSSLAWMIAGRCEERTTYRRRAYPIVVK